jgi:hypothetical protein
LVALSELKCERCGRSPDTSVAFRHWTIIAIDGTGSRKVYGPTPSLDRDGDMTIAKAVAQTTGGKVQCYCPDCAKLPPQ